MKWKVRLIENWKDCWKFWSLQLATLGTVITYVFLTFPDAAIMAWSAMPQEFRNTIPPTHMAYIGLTVFALSIVARVVRQESLRKPKDDTQAA